MPAPSQEQFEAAPLYRFRRPVDEPAPRDWTQSEVVIEGLNLVRTDGEDDAFEYRLENVLVAVGGRHEHEGEQGFRIQYLSKDEQFQIFASDREEAVARFGRMMERSIENRDEVLFARLREHDVEVDEIVENHEAEDEADDPDFDGDGPEDGGEIDVYGNDYFDPVRVVREGMRMWVQGEEASRLWLEARHEMVRVGEDGQVLCGAGGPMLEQLHRIGRGNESGARHIADIRAIRAGIGAADRIAPTDTRYAVHYFDLYDSGVVDDVVPQESLEAYRSPSIAYHDGEEGGAGLPVPVDPSMVPHDRTFERHIGEIMREEAGMHVYFEEIRTGAVYRNPTIRGVMREQMSPYLGGFPMEHVMRAQAPRDPEGHAAFVAFWSEGEVVMDVPVQTHPSQPGYRTEPGHVFRRDGWDALVFSDAMGTYAYAFPSPPDVVAKPDESEAYAPRM
ncbi:hypothetical protein [Methylobacterium brachiatum]